MRPKFEYRARLSALSIDPAKTKDLKAVVDLIVEIAAPERIVLFGSQARGTWRKDSDLDLAIINSSKRGTLKDLRKAVRALRAEGTFDLVPIDESKERSFFSPIAFEIRSHGKTLYENRSLPKRRKARISKSDLKLKR